MSNTVEYDLEYARAGVAELDDYLLSKELFWPLSGTPPGGKPFPRLTLGGLLLALARLKARELSVSHNASFTRLEAQLDGVRSRWRVAWGRKAAREYPSRLTQWRNYLDDYAKNSSAYASAYAQEARLRLILHLLEPQLDMPSSAHLSMLAGLDLRLQAKFEAGEFVWEAELAAGFPPDTFWFLYGGLPGHSVTS